MQQIADWLEKLGMSEYAQRFAENRIDFSVLPDLTDQDLKKLGVVLGDRRKMLRAIAELDDDRSALRAVAPAPVSAPSRQRRRRTVPAAAEATGERRHVTVMFCDLVGSTGIAAQLDAEEWRDLVGAYLDAASAAVTEMGGNVAKKLGDGLMALFGYPVAQENDAERAVRAALVDPASARRAEPQECRHRQAGACRTHRHRDWAGGGRCGGRDFRRRAEHRGAGAGAGRAGRGRGHGAGAAPDRRPVRRRGARQP